MEVARSAGGAAPEGQRRRGSAGGAAPEGQRRRGSAGGAAPRGLQRWSLDGDPLERLRVLVAAPLAHIAMPLAHELLEVPLAARLGDLAFVLAQRLDLAVERRRDVYQIVAMGPERDPDLFHLVRLEALLEQRSEGAGVPRVRVDGDRKAHV